MDDMDAALFGGKKPVTPTRTSTPKSPSIGKECGFLTLG